LDCRLKNLLPDTRFKTAHILFCIVSPTFAWSNCLPGWFQYPGPDVPFRGFGCLFRTVEASTYASDFAEETQFGPSG
jgi:hypothetical protein